MIPSHITILARGDSADLIQVLVFAVFIIGSAIVGWIKKQHEQKEDQAPPSPRPSQHPWPPSTTTGTTVPGPTRPAPTRAQQRPTGQPTPPKPPVAVPAPIDYSQDPMRQRAEKIEAEMRRRAEQLDRQKKQRDQQLQQELARAEQARLRAAAEESTRRVVAADAHTPSATLPDQIQAMLAKPNWRAAVVMAEIFSPPIALRDPTAQSATTPPSLTP